MTVYNFNMQLRDYQTDLIQKCRESFKTHKRVLAVLPCRAGKTVCFAYMAQEHVKRGGKVWFLVHRKELEEQAKETFQKMGINTSNIYIGMVGTALKKAAFEPSMIVFDEAHHCSAETWMKIIQTHKKCYIVGLTATPARMDGKPLGDIFEDMIIGISSKELIAKKRLSDFKYYAPDVNLKDAKWSMKGSDYDMKDVEMKLDKPAIFGEVSKLISQKRKTIIYCPTIAYSKKLAEAIPGAKHIDAETPKEERKSVLEKFRSGETRVLLNVFLFGEGLDVPDCDTVIMLRPTISLSLFIQQSMRCLTYFPGKEAIIYDLVGNVFRHGLPTNDQEWSLKKRIKRENDISLETKVRECKFCFRVYSPPNRICPYCKHDNGQTKEEIKIQRDKELKEITEMKKKKMRSEQGRAQTYEQLVELGRSRGYNNPSGWAYMVLRNRRKI